MAALSLILSLAVIWLTWRLGRSMPRAARIVLALGLFWVFEWVSPQVYYLYYIAIFDGLPWQVVIGPPPGAGQITRLLSFTEAATLSAHGRGALGWAMLVVAILGHRRL